MEQAALTIDDPADRINVANEELVRERFELPGFKYKSYLPVAGLRS
jgi:hypothetical protein